MQTELQKGTSLDDIRKKIFKGEIQAKVSKQLQKKKYFRTERIQRKKWDVTQMLNKYVAKPVDAVDEQYLTTPKALTPVEVFAKAKEELDGSPVLDRSVYKLNDKQLLVRTHMLILFLLQKDLFVGTTLNFRNIFLGTCDKACWQDKGSSSYRFLRANYSPLGII